MTPLVSLVPFLCCQTFWKSTYWLYFLTFSFINWPELPYRFIKIRSLMISCQTSSNFSVFSYFTWATFIILICFLNVFLAFLEKLWSVLFFLSDCCFIASVTGSFPFPFPYMLMFLRVMSLVVFSLLSRCSHSSKVIIIMNSALSHKSISRPELQIATTTIFPDLCAHISQRCLKLSMPRCPIRLLAPSPALNLSPWFLNQVSSFRIPLHF